MNVTVGDQTPFADHNTTPYYIRYQMRATRFGS